MFGKKSNPPIMYTSKKPHSVHLLLSVYQWVQGIYWCMGTTESTQCCLYMCGHRAIYWAWVPHSSLSAICMCMGTGPSIRA